MMVSLAIGWDNEDIWKMLHGLLSALYTTYQPMCNGDLVAAIYLAIRCEKLAERVEHGYFLQQSYVSYRKHHINVGHFSVVGALVKKLPLMRICRNSDSTHFFNTNVKCTKLIYGVTDGTPTCMNAILYSNCNMKIS